MVFIGQCQPGLFIVARFGWGRGQSWESFKRQLHRLCPVVLYFYHIGSFVEQGGIPDIDRFQGKSGRRLIKPFFFPFCRPPIIVPDIIRDMSVKQFLFYSLLIKDNVIISR